MARKPSRSRRKPRARRLWSEIVPRKGRVAKAFELSQQQAAVLGRARDVVRAHQLQRLQRLAETLAELVILKAGAGLGLVRTDAEWQKPALVSFLQGWLRQALRGVGTERRRGPKPTAPPYLELAAFRYLAPRVLAFFQARRRAAGPTKTDLARTFLEELRQLVASQLPAAGRARAARLDSEWWVSLPTEFTPYIWTRHVLAAILGSSLTRVEDLEEEYRPFRRLAPR